MYFGNDVNGRSQWCVEEEVSINIYVGEGDEF